MAYSSIVKPGDYFEATTYTGGATDVSSLSFQPDFVWAKKRSGSENHGLFDAVRGATKTLSSNNTDAESTRGGSLTSFDSDGWSMGGSDGIISASGSTYVGWAWKAGNSAGSANTDGSINSTVSVNTTAGFSIVKWTGNNGAGATVGHGLGSIPKIVLVKNSQQSGYNWVMYHASLGNTKRIWLDLTNAADTNTSSWNNTTPSSSVFTLGSSGETNGSGEMIGYCFAEKAGYSKFGSYIGNNNADGPFIYTGFKPAFVIAKNTTSSGFSWELFDNKRNATDGVANVIEKRLFPDSNAAEGSNSDGYLDFVSNGFKIRKTGDTNENNSTYIYMAFAEQPLVANSGTDGVPATAR